MLVITSECVACGECADVCPMNAIIEGEDQYYINSLCLGSQCGKCIPVCPVEAIRGSVE